MPADQSAVSEHKIPGQSHFAPVGTPVTVEEFVRAEELDAHEDEWKAFIDRCPSAGLFQTWEWFRTWLDNFWRDRPLATLVARQGGHVVGALPAVLDIRGEMWCPNSVVVPGRSLSARADLVVEDGNQAILEALFGHLRSAHRRLRLAFMHAPADSVVLGTPAFLFDRYGLRMRRNSVSANPILRLPDTWDAYLRSRSGHFRTELRRKTRKLEGSGKVEHRLVQAPTDCPSAIESLAEIERRSWKDQTNRSFSKPEYENFHTDLAHALARRGWLRLHLLYLDGRPLAHVYGVVFKGQFFALRTSYDEAYTGLSVGAVLFGRVLESAFAEKLSVFDFLGKETRWKLEMANGTRQHEDICIYSSRDLRCVSCAFYNTQLKPLLKKALPFLTKSPSVPSRDRRD